MGHTKPPSCGLLQSLLEVPDAIAPQRYTSLRRLLTLLMVAVSVTPLLILTAINHAQYRDTMQRELEIPLRGIVNKTRASLQLFLGERAATVSLLSEAYSFEELAQERTFTKIFRALKSEFKGFVDLELIDAKGKQVSYAGPYDLKDKDYADQSWFQQAELKGHYITDVFMGLRGAPHMVIAVSRTDDKGQQWLLRCTIDTEQLNTLVSGVGVDPDTDTFLVNRQGVLQTASRYYGGVLEILPIPMPRMNFDTTVQTITDTQGREMLLDYTYLPDTELVLMALKPRKDFLKPWTTLKSDIFLLLALSIGAIVWVSYGLMGLLMSRLQASDERRVAAFAQMEHSQKLSSIGRLAAGVAHEVNNPLAIINEKAGLALDFLHMGGDFSKKDRLISLVEGIVTSVERARGITHRLLGFSRRMDAQQQEIQLKEILNETLEFLEREAQHRGVSITSEVSETLPKVHSDRGQLQQVFLNILGNALAAVNKGGRVSVSCQSCLLNNHPAVRIAVRDTGKGMSQDVLQHIFEPFYSTKKHEGTGLGMFITYGIVKRLGGSIEVESAVGQGTTVTITLPLNPQEFQGTEA
ncbi:MAG: ATP-binding protein [Desulfovibrionaceae bacterium]